MKGAKSCKEAHTARNIPPAAAPAPAPLLLRDSQDVSDTVWRRQRIGGNGNCFFLALALATNFKDAQHQTADAALALADTMRTMMVSRERWERFMDLAPEDPDRPSFERAVNPRVDVDAYLISFVAQEYGINFRFPDALVNLVCTTPDAPWVHMGKGNGHFEPLLRTADNPPLEMRLWQAVMMSGPRVRSGGHEVWSMCVPSDEVGFKL